MIFDARDVKRLAFESYGWKNGYSLPLRRGGVVGGSIPSYRFFACANAALHFSLQILAKVFRNDPRRRQFAQIRHRELGKIRKNRGQGRRGMADQREPNVVSDGPFAVLHDRRYHRRGQLFPRQHSQNLRFGHVGVVQHNGNGLRVTLGKQRARDPRWSSPRQRDFLAERKLRQTREQLLFGVALQLGGNTGQDRHLHKVHQIEVAEQTQADQPRRPWMKRQRSLHPVTLEQWFTPRNLLENF